MNVLPLQAPLMFNEGYANEKGMGPTQKQVQQELLLRDTQAHVNVQPSQEQGPHLSHSCSSRRS